jgi:peptidoglycan/LPS O-acetylase OafA/YrhL
VERSPARRGWVGLIDRFPGACVALSGLAFAAMVHFAPQSHPNVPVLHLVSTPVGFGQEEANYWLCAIAAALLMLPVVFGDQRRGLTRRLLAARPLAGLGVISYGVYLYHDPLLGWFAPKIGSRPSLWLAGSPSTTLFVLTLVVSVPLAVLSYRLVELPFLRRRYRRPGGTDSAARAASRLRSVRIRRRARIAEEPAEV